MIDSLRRLARWILDDRDVKRLVDPTIADTAWERQQLLHAGLVWQSRWLACLGCAALIRVVAAGLVQSAIRGVRSGPGQHDDALARVLVFTALAVALLTLALVLPPYLNMPNISTASQAAILLTLVPQAFCVALPFGFLAGAIVALRGRAAGVRVFCATIGVSLFFSLLTFIVVALIVPRTNQAFRVMVAGERSPSLPEPLKGPNEMTLSELTNRIQTFEVRPGLAREVRRLRYAYQVRWALAWLPLALAFFAFGLSAFGRGRWSTALVGILSVAACWALMLLADSESPASVWLPHLVFGLPGAALSLKAIGRQQTA